MRSARIAWLAGAAVSITACQILVATFLGPLDTAGENYRKLCNWDCGWYMSITKDGYHSVIPPVPQKGELANVAFFPGYPIAARAVHLVTGVEPPTALLIVSQAFCAAFWFALLLLLAKLGVPDWLSALSVALVFAHPAAFFLVTGYSESMFLTSLLLFIHGSVAAKRRAGFWITAAAGALMTASRIVGLPVAGFPVLRSVCERGTGRAFREWRSAGRPLALSALASAGGLGFFAYCGIRWGHPMLYMETQRIGWGIVPDYAAIWEWSSFRYLAPYEALSTIAAAWGLGFLWLAEFALAEVERRRWFSDPFRIPTLLCLTAIFYLTVCGLKGMWFRSMIRYTLPCWVLAVVLLADAARRIPAVPGAAKGRWRWPVRLGAAAAIAGLGAFAWTFEYPPLVDFLSGVWFA